MKAKKSRVILSGVSLLLVLCLLVGGTMAWFTDTEKVDTNFTAGILDVSVKPGEEGKTALDFENLRPMLYENFYKELDKNEWNNDVTQGGTTGLKDSDYDPVPAYFKPVEITNEGTLPTKVKLSLEAGNGCADGEPILTDDNITITQDGSKQDCANRLAPVLKVFVYKLVGEDWTLVEGVNLNTAYDEDAANPDGVASENTAEEANSTYMTAMIPANGTAQYVIAGYLPETVGNAYQGQHYHGNLVLNAYQMDDTAAGNPDEGGSSSEDPDDPDRFEDNVTIEWRENTADGTLVQSRKVTVKSDTTIAAADYDAPQGYVYSPAAADQSSAVTVDDKTGAATPATVVFTVVEEEAETIEYVLQYRNTVNDQLLTETKTVSLEVPGEYTIATPDWAGRTVTITAPLPEGYVFDPAVQSFNVSVDAEGVATPATVTFGVKPEDSGEEPDPGTDPEEPENPDDCPLPHIIHNQEELSLVDQHMGHNFILANDITLTGNWKVLGLGEDADIPFTGTFDGNNHTISGLNVSKNGLTNLGLFAVNNGTIENLSLNQPNITSSNGDMMGSIAGDNKGIISNCHVIGGSVEANATGTNYNLAKYVGGLVGQNGSNGTIICSSSSAYIKGLKYVGGLVGANFGQIDQSYATGNINTTIADSTLLSNGAYYLIEGNYFLYSQIGGLVGENSMNGVIRNCYATNSMKAFDYVGGICGTNYGQVIDSFGAPVTIFYPYNYNYGIYTLTADAVHPSVGANYDGYGEKRGTLSGTYCVAMDGLPVNYEEGDRGAIVKSSTDLRKASTYSGWDTSIWDLQDGEYPDLMNNRR